MAWKLKDVTVITHVPRNESEEQEAKSTRLYGWDVEGGGDKCRPTHRSPKIYVKFAQPLGQLPEQSDIAKSMERVWKLIYSTLHVFTMAEAGEVLHCLPIHERRSVKLKRRHLSASTEHMAGFVAAPKVQSLASTFYIVHMYSGLWIFHISTKLLNLVTRNTLSLNMEVGMQRLPVFAYSSRDNLYLDPVIPFSFPKKKLLRVIHGRGRALYDLQKLNKLADQCREHIPHLALNVRVGSAWQLGESEQVLRGKFANTEGVIRSHRDIVDYRKYVQGDTYVNREMGMYGLRLVDQCYQLEASAEADSAVMLVCKVCTLPVDKRQTCREYQRNVSSQFPDVVAFLGTRIFPFEDLTKRAGLADGIAYHARLRLGDDMSSVHVQILDHLGEVNDLPRDMFALTLAMAERVWLRIVNPVCPFLMGYHSLLRTNLRNWFAVSKSLNLLDENVKLLVVSTFSTQLSRTYRRLGRW